MAPNVNFYRKDLFGYGITYHVPVPDDGKIAVDIHLKKLDLEMILSLFFV